METINDLVQVLMRHPEYTYRVKYDPMDNKIITRLGSLVGQYSEVKYNIGSEENW